MFGLTNWLKTLSERDSARLRRLETKVQSIEDDITQTLLFVDRINARLRTRAARAAAAGEGAGEGDGSGHGESGSGNGDGGGGSRFTPPAAHQAEGSVIPISKDQMRQLGRAKGIRA